AVDPRLAAGQLRLDQENVTGSRRTPEHAPVAPAVGKRLATIVTQSDERVLAGHEDVVRIHRTGHIELLASESRLRLRTACRAGAATEAYPSTALRPRLGPPGRPGRSRPRRGRTRPPPPRRRSRSSPWRRSPRP